MKLTRRNRRLMLITGATGFLGRHLVLASEAGRWELLAESSTSLDITRRGAVLDHIGTWRPNVVVHLAYRKGDRRTIVDGTRNVADAAAAAGARLIHLSTDVVFGGRPESYSEHDVPDAVIDYGRWKAEAEQEVMAAHPSALMLRTSLLYGTDELSIGQREVAAVVSGRQRMAFFTDEFRCPAHAADVAAAIVTLSDRSDVDGVLHVAGPEAVSRAELARAYAIHQGYDPALVPTASLADAEVERPANVVLDSSRAASIGIRCRAIDEALLAR